MSLVQQFDYYGKLGSQFPIASLRMVYAKAGSQPAACLLRDKRAVIDHKLYWMTPVSENRSALLDGDPQQRSRASASGTIPISRAVRRARF